MKQQFWSIVLLLGGEALAIFAELFAAHQLKTANQSKLFLQMSLLMAVAGAALIGGYMLGYKAFANVWVVIALSIGAILVIEPIIAYMLFKELPTRGAIIGLVLGITGMAASLFIK